MRVLAVPVAVGALALCLGVPAYTAGNLVPATKAGQTAIPITPDSLKPAACAGITLTTLVIGSTGTGGNDLLLGTAAVDVMSGGAGNDCILAGAGSDTIDGGAGTDVCIGGPGTNIFVPLSCETQL
jgi:Ca2+-binding RTX toxin-like protein